MTRQRVGDGFHGRPEGRRYSVGVYNAMVRALSREMGEGTPGDADGLDSRWADLRHQEVIAENADQARRLAARIFPADDGYVITEVRVVDAAA